MTGNNVARNKNPIVIVKLPFNFSQHLANTRSSVLTFQKNLSCVETKNL